jgi:hypothetical protein
MGTCLSLLVHACADIADEVWPLAHYAHDGRDDDDDEKDEKGKSIAPDRTAES